MLATDPRLTNRLLALLSPVEYARLQPHLKSVSYRLRDVVYQAGAVIEHVYFPLSGVFSVLAVMRDGSTCEVNVLGYEGIVHAMAALGAESSPQRVVCQVDGEVLRLSVTALRDELAQEGNLRRLVHAYILYAYEQMSQTTACNRHHAVTARCARWLLMTHDRVGGDEFPITHEFLSTMLGIRRPSVTLTLAHLQRRGLIAYQRGKVTVLRRDGLEESACECYPVILTGYDRLVRTSAMGLGD